MSKDSFWIKMSNAGAHLDKSNASATKSCLKRGLVENDNTCTMQSKKTNYSRVRCAPTLLDLPPEILIQILGYLPYADLHKRVALVSKYFLTLSREPDLNKKIFLYGKRCGFWIFDNLHFADCDRVFELHVENGGLGINFLQFDYHAMLLKKLTIVNCESTSMLIHDLMCGKRCRNLQELHLDNVQLSGDNVNILMKIRGHILRTFRSPNSRSVGYTALSHKYKYLHRCKHLERLSLNDKLSFWIFEEIFALKELKELELTRLSLTYENFCQMFSEANWRGLQKLELGIVDKLDDVAFNGLLSVAPTLQSLRLHGCKKLTIGCFLGDEKKSKLKIMELLGCSKMTDCAFSHAVSCFPKLEFLDISSFELFSTASIASTFKNRKNLIVGHNNQVYFNSGLSLKDFGDLDEKHKGNIRSRNFVFL